MTALRILLSNDDGVHAAGLQALASSLRPLGELWIVAPDRERSAISHAISLNRPLRIRQLKERVFAVDGTPTDCVCLGIQHLIGHRPDIVVSGINHGPNVGNDIIYSGTVAAAMEGALNGCPALAVSLCMMTHESSPDFAVAAEITTSLTRSMLGGNWPKGVVLNVNVPLAERSEIRGRKLCRLGYTDWGDAVTERTDPRGRAYYWIGGQRGPRDAIVDSDTNAIAQGFVSLTPLHYDLTDHRAFAHVRGLAVDGIAAQSDELGCAPLPHPPLPR